MANFPINLDDSSSLPNPTGTATQNNPDHAGLHTAENTAIIALESKVGTGATTPASGTLLIGTGSGTSAWSALTSAQLASVLSDETGSGSAVFANTPTLITPRVDTIQENTVANGVTIDGVNLKDGIVTGSGAGLTSNTIPGGSLTNNSVTGQQISWASTGANAGIWWEELGRTTLSGAADVITVAGFSARTHLQLRILGIQTVGTINFQVTFNSDTGSNYAFRISVNGGADVTSTSQAALALAESTAAYDQFSVAEIMNFAGQEKLLYADTSSRSTAGAANAPSRREISGKWTNTSAQITTVTVTNTGTGDYATGSTVVVVGHN